jgi:hypothetical protein
MTGLQSLFEFVDLFLLTLTFIEQKVRLNYFVESLVIEDIEAELCVGRITGSRPHVI